MEALVRIRNSASLLGPAGRGTARLLMERVMAAPRRVFVGAGLAAIVAAIGGNALLLQIGRHPAPLFAAAPDNPLPASADKAPPLAAVELVAPHVSPTPVAASDTAPAAPPPAATSSRATRARAPDTTSSIQPAAQQEQRLSLGAAAPDQIGALLRGKPVDDGSHLVRAAQIALAKLGFAVKPDGAEDGATRRALRHFERAHGLAPTTEISPELVKQLTTAAGTGH
jgi:hypothetical protein